MTPTTLLQRAVQRKSFSFRFMVGWRLLIRLFGPVVTALCFALCLVALEATQLLEWTLVCWMAVVSVLIGQATVLMLAIHVEARLPA